MKLCWVLIILFVAVLAWSSQEHMTNKDLIAALKTYGVDDSGQVKPKPPPERQEIYGPGLKESEKAPPKPLSEEDEAKKRKMRSSYPHIYGPEYQGAPGQSFDPPGLEKSEKPYDSRESSKTEEPYLFNPDYQSAFPVDGPPQPFLTDFSKFQK
jgi:hypothetical protein